MTYIEKSLQHGAVGRQHFMATGGFDWNLCIFCQSVRLENLHCPALQSHLRQDVGRGYITVAQNINGFIDLGYDFLITKLNIDSIE